MLSYKDEAPAVGRVLVVIMEAVNLIAGEDGRSSNAWISFWSVACKGCSCNLLFHRCVVKYIIFTKKCCSSTCFFADSMLCVLIFAVDKVHG